MLRGKRSSSSKSRVSSDRLHRAVFESLEQRRLLSGTLTLINPDGIPGNNRLIFNVIKNLNTTVPNVTDNSSVLKLENTGAAPLTINSITASGPFSVSALASNTIAPGASENVTVTFTQTTLPAHSVNETNFTTDPNGGAAIDGSLTISSSDTAAPSQALSLAGYWQNESENNDEPNLTTIVNNVAGYQTVISSPYEVDLTEPNDTAKYYGSEVVSAQWAAANPAQPVLLQTLASFHTQGNTVHTYYYTSNNPNGVSGITTHLLTTSNPSEGQTILPTLIGANGQALAAGQTVSFSPGGNFGLRVDNEYSNDAINIAQNNLGGGGHHFRFYPLVDSSGNTVPNTYIVAMDYAVIQSENFDFQDNVYIVSNIRPTTSPPAPTNLTAVNGAQPVLSWSAVTYSNLQGYDVLRSSSASGPFTLLTSTPITATTYTDTTAPGGVTVYYQVTAVDSASGLQSSAASTTANTPGGPVAVADSANAFAGQAVSISVLANDTDPTGSINPTTVTIVSQPNHGGTVSVNATTGVVTYTSVSGFSGTETSLTMNGTPTVRFHRPGRSP